jgi:hypothetical protein
MISCVRDLAYKLGFFVVIAKFDNRRNGRKRFVTLGCQRCGQYKEYPPQGKGREDNIKSSLSV